MLSNKFISFLRINTANVNVRPLISSRNISATRINHCEAKELSENTEEAVKEIDPRIDRTKIVPVEVSQRYLKSSAYDTTYGDQPVWLQYRRNFKGLYPPNKTRKTCVRKGLISTGNPCPICRDEYLVLDHNNVDLLQQFISPQTGKVLSYSKTGLCQKSHLELLVAIERAKDRGLITFDVQFRDYTEYYKSA